MGPTSHSTEYSHRPHPRLLLGFLLVWIGIITTSSRADELHLRNGDRVTGTLVRRGEGKIYFRSTLLGELVVSETEASVIEAPETPVESLAGLPPHHPSDPAHPPAQADPKAPATATSAAPNAVAATPKKPDTSWKGKIEFGYQNQSGRTNALNLTLRADAERTVAVDNYRFNFRYLNGKTGASVSADRQDASFRWRHELSEKLFGQAVSSYSADKVKQINSDIEQNVGVGYKVLERSRQTASVGTGVTLQYRDAVAIEHGLTYLGEFFQDYTYKVNGRLTLSQDSNAQFSPESRGQFTYVNNQLVPTQTDARNYKLRFNTTLQGKVTNTVSLNLRFEYEYDNAIYDPNARTDQRVSSSIGYAF